MQIVEMKIYSDEIRFPRADVRYANWPETGLMTMSLINRYSLAMNDVIVVGKKCIIY